MKGHQNHLSQESQVEAEAGIRDVGSYVSQSPVAGRASPRQKQAWHVCRGEISLAVCVSTPCSTATTPQ